jgi:hypothetical protein
MCTGCCNEAGAQKAPLPSTPFPYFQYKPLLFWLLRPGAEQQSFIAMAISHFCYASVTNPSK